MGQAGAGLLQAGLPAFRRPKPLLLLSGELPPAALGHLACEPANQQATAKHAQHRCAREPVGTGYKHQAQQQHYGAPGRIPRPAQFCGQQRQQQDGETQQQRQESAQGGEHGQKTWSPPLWAPPSICPYSRVLPTWRNW